VIRLRALVEDLHHQHALMGLLDRRRMTRQVRFEPVPSGRQAGEQWVREHFARFVRELRTRRHQAGLWGVVVIDGDTEGWSRRRARLLQGLEATGEAPLSSSDRILIMVPTRNIQTWGWVLLGNDADEQTDFAHRLLVPLRDVFAERWEPASPHELPSLIAGRAEWSRLP
jgi:hypothetical protein